MMVLQGLGELPINISTFQLMNMNIHLDSVLSHSDSATCVTMTIAETSPYGTPSAINIFCGFSWKANTIYRQLQATTTTDPKYYVPIMILSRNRIYRSNTPD